MAREINPRRDDETETGKGSDVKKSSGLILLVTSVTFGLKSLADVCKHPHKPSRSTDLTVRRFVVESEHFDSGHSCRCLESQTGREVRSQS
jgi:hypothetical protein